MIEYTYEVKKVDDVFNIIEVEYTATGHQPVLVCMMKPNENQTIDEVVKSHEPLIVWGLDKPYEAPIELPVTVPKSIPAGIFIPGEPVKQVLVSEVQPHQTNIL